MAGNIRITAELNDQLSKNLKELAQKTSQDLNSLSSKLRDAEASLKGIGNSKAYAGQRAEVLKTIDALKRERDEIIKNEKAEEQRLKGNFGSQLKHRLEIEKTTLAYKSLSGALGALGGISAVGFSAKSLLDTSGQFEQYQTSLKVLTGSSESAQKSFDWIKDFATKTPYELSEVMESFIRLKAYGIDATDGSLKTLGDTSSALGKPLMSAVEAMADAMTGENERLKEFGIKAKKMGDDVKYSWIDASGQSKEKIVSNNSEIIKSTLEAIFNDKYKGMMAEQAKTWNGQLSNLADSWTNLKDTIARDTGLFDLAKSSLEGVNGVLSNQNGELDTFVRYAKDAAVAGGTFYAVTVGASAVQSIMALTRAQTALNLATLAWNRLLAVNPLILGGMALAGGIAYFYDLSQKADAEAKKAYEDRLKLDAAYASHYATLEGKAEKMGSSYGALEKSLAALQKARESATGENVKRLDDAISKTESQMRRIQTSAKQLYSVSAPNLSPTTAKAPKTTLKAPKTTKATIITPANDFDVYGAMLESRQQLEQAYAETDKKTQVDKWANYLQVAEPALKKESELHAKATESMKENIIEMQTVAQDAFRSMEDSLVKMFMTGKFSAQDFFNTIIEGMIRMQIRNSITAPLMQAMSGINFGSIFSFGSGAVNPASASDFGMVDSVSYGGFASGGYTGAGGRNDVAGIVHRGEYVIPQWMTNKSPALIESLERVRLKGYADGGMVGGAISSAPQNFKVEIVNNSGTPLNAEASNVRFDGKEYIMSVVIDSINRNAHGARDIIRGVR